MKFSEFKYERPDIDKVEGAFNSALNGFENAESAESAYEKIKELNVLRSDFDTMRTIARVNYTINTLDNFWADEQQYYDNISPVYEGFINRYYKLLIDHPHKAGLEAFTGQHIFKLAESSSKIFKPEVIDDMIKENLLTSEYKKILAGAKVMFEGEERNLSSISPFLQSADREKRKQADNAKWEFFSDNADELDRIYDELVKVRHDIAVKLGFKNYVEFSYAKLRRTDYTPEMTANFRKQILEEVVPLAVKFKQEQKERLGVDEFMSYDNAVIFPDGNATPKGSPEWITAQARTMYSELSSETGEFFNFLADNDLMDLYTRKGKAVGGYCTFFEKYKSPFIFANLNGTSDDVRVLTHEAGHAFQCYKSRDFEIPEYHFPTLEACEIHSMSMEFITWEWMNLFFKEDTDKFKYAHLEHAVTFLPYGTAVDEFQVFVYENVNATPDERKAKWRELEQKYTPWKNYSENEYLDKGGFWQQQRHIYEKPFYYIDYCLAQICAFQFWKRFTENKEATLRDYIALCEAGGSRSFVDLCTLAGLQSPFQDGVVKEALIKPKEFAEQHA